MKNKKIDLTVVIPALREEDRIGKTLKQLAGYISRSSLEFEVIVIAADGGDNTVGVSMAHKSHFKHFRVIKPGLPVGKGRDVQMGMLAASGSAVLFMDADLATPLKYIDYFYEQFNHGYDVVIATRNLKKHHQNNFRRFISTCGNVAFRLLSGVVVEDSQCGFKLFSHDAARFCFERLTIMRWGFDMEVLAIAKLNGYKIHQVRVDDWKHMDGGTFEDRPFRNALRSLADLCIILKNRILSKY